MCKDSEKRENDVLKELNSVQELVEPESDWRGRNWEEMALEKEAEAGPVLRRCNLSLRSVGSFKGL